MDPGEGYDEIVAGTVRQGSIDRNYIAQLETAAQGGDPTAVARVAVAHHAAAQFQLRKGEVDQAISHYRRALTFAPEHLAILLNLSYVHLRRSEYSPALEYLERARRVAPDSPDVAKLAGWAYYGQNRIEQALKEWKRALSLKPDPEVEQAIEKAQRDAETEREYRDGETRHFQLRYHGGAAPQLAREILRALEEHFRAIESELNYTPPEPIGVILYTEQAFSDITRAPGWVGAINDGRIRVPVQGLTSVPADLSRTLKHELTHSFVHQKTRGRCPVWLHEGIAQWLEGARAGQYADAFVAAYQKHGRGPSLASFEGSWMNYGDDLAAGAYAWSLAVVEYVVRAFGMGDVVRLLDRVAVESSTEAAVRSVLRVGYDELVEDTIKYFRRTYLR
jgi:tetratricopeptide (TPR) repeat protein